MKWRINYTYQNTQYEVSVHGNNKRDALNWFTKFHDCDSIQSAIEWLEPYTPPVAELPNEAEGKAKELVKAIKKINWRGDPESDKAIAAYCVDEILKTDAARYTHQEQYWQQVRTAINQL